MSTTIETNQLPDTRTRRIARIALAILAAFTVVAVLGYATFGRHPELLQLAPALASVYAPAFTFFAQGHVVLSGIVLLLVLSRSAGARWVPAFLCVYVISLTAELLGTQTGFPFGGYGYTPSLGPRWFGHVPILIPLSWFCMAVPAYIVASRLAPDKAWMRIVFASALLTSWDLALDPAMSFVTSYWIWQEPGIYYGMPLVNLLGWFGTGVLIAFALERLGAGSWTQPGELRWYAAYYAVVATMPVFMLAAAGLWGAVLLTVATVALCVFVMNRLRRADVGLDHPGEPEDGADETPVIGRRAAGFEHATAAPAELLLNDVRVESRRFVEKHSRSFSLACRFLAPGDREVVENLYRFCRTTDDLVDLRCGESRDLVEAELDEWIALARAAYDGQTSGLTWLDDLMHRSRAAGVPFTLVTELAEGVRTDLGSVAMQTMRELDLYCYRVASVVGIWLCHLSGVHEPDVLKRAALMGRAMQLTNVLRDVGEDLEHDRVYLPDDLMRRYRVTRSDLEEMYSGRAIAPEYRQLLSHLMQEAERSYDEAWSGLSRLPTRTACSFAVAAAVYQGILPEIRNSGYQNLRRRAFTSAPRKLVLACSALIRFYRSRNRLALRAPAVRRSAPLPRIAGRGAVVLVVALAAASMPGIEQLSQATAIASHSVVAFAPLNSNPTVTNRSTNWLENARATYLLAVEDPSVIEEAQAALEHRTDDDPTAAAYFAAFTVLEAKHARWPHLKLRFLNRGLGELDDLVEAHPDQVEIRYLRLLSCYFLPRFFGRTESVEEDFAALGRLLPDSREQFGPELYRQMVRFVLESGAPSADQREMLNASL